MSIFVYNQHSPIDEVAIMATESGAQRAYLHAGPTATAAQLADAKSRMVDEGWQCVPVTYLGRPTLEVRGFKKQEKLCEFLDKHKFTLGVSRHFPTADQDLTLLDKMKKRSLQVSGGLYMFGDVNFLLYGLKEGSALDALGGLAYGAGTQFLVGYGRNDQSDLQVRDVSRRMMRHLMEKSVQLPEDSAMATIAEEHKQTTWEKLNETFRRNPSEMFCALTFLAGACVATAALKHKALAKPPGHYNAQAVRDMRIEGWSDVGLGTVTMAATAIGGLLPEKHRDADEPPPNNLLGKVYEWVREKPLRVTGYGLMLSTFCHANSTRKAWVNAVRTGDEKRKKSVPFRMAFIISNVIAEFMMAISSKGHGEGVKSDNTVDESIYAIAAELIAKQPPSMQSVLVDYMAEYLQRPEVLGGVKEEIAQQLNQQIDGMKVNPWGCSEVTYRHPPAAEFSGWQKRLNHPVSSQPDQGFYI